MFYCRLRAAPARERRDRPDSDRSMADRDIAALPLYNQDVEDEQVPDAVAALRDSVREAGRVLILAIARSAGSAHSVRRRAQLSQNGFRDPFGRLGLAFVAREGLRSKALRLFSSMLFRGLPSRWAVLFASAMCISATWAHASSAGAPLSVSVTVVRSCSIHTGASTAGLTLRCASGVSQVRVDQSPSPTPLLPGPNALRRSTSSPMIPSPATQLVTINF